MKGEFKTMERVAVSSSNLSSVGYDAESQTLEIEFHNGGVYQYAGVPEEVYEGLLSADSQGKYFSRQHQEQLPIQQTLIPALAPQLLSTT
jgi:hypothetical protein